MEKKHTLSWANYCPRMTKAMTWEDIKRERLNKEAELMIPDRKVEMPDNRKLVAYIKSLKKQKWQPGLYNLAHYTIQQFIV